MKKYLRVQLPQSKQILLLDVDAIIAAGTFYVLWGAPPSASLGEKYGIMDMMKMLKDALTSENKAEYENQEKELAAITQDQIDKELNELMGGTDGQPERSGSDDSQPRGEAGEGLDDGPQSAGVGGD